MGARAGSPRAGRRTGRRFTTAEAQRHGNHTAARRVGGGRPAARDGRGARACSRGRGGHGGLHGGRRRRPWRAGRAHRGRGARRRPGDRDRQRRARCERTVRRARQRRVRARAGLRRQLPAGTHARLRGAGAGAAGAGRGARPRRCAVARCVRGGPRRSRGARARHRARPLRPRLAQHVHRRLHRHRRGMCAAAGPGRGGGDAGAESGREHGERRQGAVRHHGKTVSCRHGRKECRAGGPSCGKRHRGPRRRSGRAWCRC